MLSGGKEEFIGASPPVQQVQTQLQQVSATFRQDLFYRLGVFVVELPPLRQRVEDIPLLVGHFAQRFAQHLNRPVPDIHPETITFLKEYQWPGNVRELEHVKSSAPCWT